MEQVKVFSLMNHPEGLEYAINTWFAEMEGQIEILQRDVVATGRIDQVVTVIYHYRLLVSQ